MRTQYSAAVESVAKCTQACVRDGLRGKALEAEIFRLAAEHSLPSATIQAGITRGKARMRQTTPARNTTGLRRSF